jgi:hypothetical protein
MSAKAIAAIAAMLLQSPLPWPLSPLLLLLLPQLHFVDCCLPLPFLLLSTTTITTLPTIATATPVSILTPSLDNPGIVALSS